MSPISNAELLSIQSAASLAACDQSCTIQRATRTTDAQGGAATTWNTVATCNAGMSQPTASQMQNYQYIIGSLSAWQLRFPVGTNVQELDHAIIGGQTLEIVKVLTPRSYQALLTCLASEVK